MYLNFFPNPFDMREYSFCHFELLYGTIFLASVAVGWQCYPYLLRTTEFKPRFTLRMKLNMI